MAADDMLELVICRIPGLKPKERVDLVPKLENLKLSSLSKEGLEKIMGRGLKGPLWTIGEISSQAEKDAMRADKLGIKRVYWRDEAYPPLLREISDPPLVLFYRGSLPDPLKAMVAIVGTRKPTSQARARAFELGRDLGKAGFPVVSGLALGIDSMAHKGNIEAGAPTVAILGSGPDVLYPPSNKDLARRILEAGGAIMSEYPPGTEPLKWNFPARNRIISGLSRGTVVVEAPERSGALITANFALDQDRDLWMDMTGLESKRGGGMAKFVEDGAMTLSTVNDILAEWKMQFPLETGHPDDANSETCNDGAGLAASLAKEFGIKL